MCRTTFETSWGKIESSLGMKLTTDVSLLFLSAVCNIYLFFRFFWCHRCGLWNQLNQQLFVMSLMGLPVQLKRMSKKLSWKMIVFANAFGGEETAVREWKTY